MNPSVERIVSRFLAFRFGAEEYRPPKWVPAAIEEGKLDARVLVVWKYVVKNLTAHGQHFEYGAGIKYWRNKCAKLGYIIPEEYLTGGGGEGGTGRFRQKNGDEIEEWVRECLKNRDLIDSSKSKEVEIRMEIGHVERLLNESKSKLEEHLAKIGLESGKKSDQRRKWIEGAQSKVTDFSKQITDLEKALAAVMDEIVRYDSHKAPVIAFEKAFRALIEDAIRSLDKKDIVGAVEKGLSDFDKSLDVADVGGEREASGRQAGILDSIGGLVSKTWNFLTNAWSNFTGWISDLFQDSKEIGKILDEANAD